MGDPRKIKAKYHGPAHPWQLARMEEERALLKDYGLKNKKEIWKASSKLKGFANQAKKLIATRGAQAELEKKQLIDRLVKLGLVKPGASLDDVLSITLRNLLDRRLQTLVCKQKLARTLKQARQFITHGHIFVNGRKITSPSSFITIEEEPTIAFCASSSLANPTHPERAQKPAATPAKVAAKTEAEK